MEIDAAMQELEKSLMSSGEFISLMRIKQEITKNPKIASLLTAFNKKQENLYASNNLSPSQLQAILDEINSDYEKLSTIPEIKRYFTAVDAFNKLFSSVLNRLQASLGKKISNG